MEHLHQFVNYLKNLNWEVVRDELTFWFFMVVVAGLFFRILYVIFVTSKNISKKKHHDFKDPIVEKIMKEKSGISHEQAHAIAEAIREEGVHAQEEAEGGKKH